MTPTAEPWLALMPWLGPAAGSGAGAMADFVRAGREALETLLAGALGGAGRDPAIAEFGKLLQGEGACASPAAWGSLLAGLYQRLLAGGAAGAEGRSVLNGLDRTHGAVADALGLGPPRALQRAAREMMAAGLERQRAQDELAAFLNAGWPRVAERVNERLAARAEPVASVLELARLWVAAAEEAFQEMLQSERGLALIAATVRAATRYRLEWNRVVEVWSEAVNVPTRAEVDEAYREIQELKRALRALRKEAPRPARRERRRA
jgi:class III poly(R)-hydroxyalkanoic acid synthase PhaE subunit